MSAAAPLFDVHVAVDWSAAGRPVRGKDSIWIGRVEGEGPAVLANPSTRAEAMEALAAMLAADLAAGRRALVGFDFAFGYPAGAAEALFGAPGWRAAWAALAEGLSEGPENANDRFELADRLVARGAPFWGHPQGRGYDHLRPARPAPGALAEFREAERFAKGLGRRAPFSPWQLSGAGAVGGQSLTGIAALERLRADPRIAGRVQVWPFETGLAAPVAPLAVAEIWPSLMPPHPDEPVRDAGQVRAVAECFARLDREGRLAALFAGPEALSAGAREAVVREEGWILGLGAEAAFAPPAGGAGATAVAPVGSRAPAPAAQAARPERGSPASGVAQGGWERDPAKIYATSFATARAECDLSGFSPAMQELALRVVHSCGMPEIARGLAFSEGAVEAGIAALDARAPVICDVGMVAQGVIRRGRCAGVEVISALDHPGCAALARAQATTRSAAAMDLAAERLGGAVVAIGNAPTALFRLLELIDAGAPRPALILGFPVGFVGAAESKDALAADPRGVPFVALRGRVGGSAMAAAAVNALSLGLRGDGLAGSDPAKTAAGLGESA
ncbi:precorrin-8X methylmutase [uncultured Albimonas sp.]|uniref:precorrin-8X methylmutase n=1 Tax=uncultured Albimonas sp. TaxID=1331701 RepID=UPI0030EC1B44